MAKVKESPAPVPVNSQPPPAVEPSPAPASEPRIDEATLLERMLTTEEEKELVRRSSKRDPRQYIVTNMDLTDAKQRLAVCNALNLPCKSLKEIAGGEIGVDGWIMEAKMITNPETGEIAAGRALTLLLAGKPVASFASEISIEQFLLIRDSVDDDWPRPWRIFVHRITNPKSGRDWYPLELLEPKETKS
jgi:hypothetical protein